MDDQARNCIIVVPGANFTLTPGHVTAAADAIRSAHVVLCQLEVPPEASLEAFRLARAAGVRTVLNPSPARPLSEELLRSTDLCIPNETEVASLTVEVFQRWLVLFPFVGVAFAASLELPACT